MCCVQYDTRVTIGGVPCSVYQRGVGHFACILPLFDYDPSVAYDAVVFSDAGNVTLPGAVQYTSAPTLISVDPCVGLGGSWSQWRNSVECPYGSTITLQGARFPAAESFVVRFGMSYDSSYATLDLLSPARLNVTTITGQWTRRYAASAALLLAYAD